MSLARTTYNNKTLCVFDTGQIAVYHWMALRHRAPLMTRCGRAADVY